MNIPSIATLNTGSDYHLLDHIAPLASLLQAPLIVTQEMNFSLAASYYPHVRVEWQEDLAGNMRPLADRFDALVECKYWLPHVKTLFAQLYKKEMRLIFCPHGQSDKGFSSPLLVPYAQQDIVLLYGKLLMNMLQTLHIWEAIDHFAVVGDYRFLEYVLHQPFYDSMAQKEVFAHLRKERPVILYAPTWQDADGASSFFRYGKMLLDQLPPDWNLLIKVHPLLEQRNSSQYYAMLRYVENRDNVHLISHFPLIHPLLQKVDVYVGDFSSVGYDFLRYKRPMFFFPHPTLPEQKLQQCGRVFDLQTPLFSCIEKHLSPSFSLAQRKLHQWAYGKSVCTAEDVRRAIFRTLHSPKRKI